MLNIICLAAIALHSPAAASKAHWPESSLETLAAQRHVAGAHRTIKERPGQISGLAQGTTVKSVKADPTDRVIVLPFHAGNEEAASALATAEKDRKAGNLAAAAAVLESSLAEYPQADIHYSETLNLADLDFRLGRNACAYDLLSAYVAQYRGSSENISLYNQRFLLYVSLALAKAGQTFPGQKEYCQSLLISNDGLQTQDLPSGNSPHDIALLSYLALAWDLGGNDALWFYQQAYQYGGPTAYLDEQLARFSLSSKNPQGAMRYLNDAATRVRGDGVVRHDVEGLRQQCLQMLAARGG